ncbi:MAG: hypothetical protein ACLFR6_05635 [Salinarchaeum sp.]
MSPRHREFEHIRSILEDADEPLTAREIVEALDAEAGVDSPHRVATVLGSRAEYDEIDVIQDQPYRYRL